VGGKVMSAASQATTWHRGKVKWFNGTKGYGFISSDTALPGKKDVFVHYTGIAMRGYRKLEEGQEVEFQVEEGAKGPQAIAVSVLQPEAGNEG